MYRKQFIAVADEKKHQGPPNGAPIDVIVSENCRHAFLNIADSQSELANLIASPVHGEQTGSALNDSRVTSHSLLATNQNVSNYSTSCS